MQRPLPVEFVLADPFNWATRFKWQLLQTWPLVDTIIDVESRPGMAGPVGERAIWITPWKGILSR
jgi:hypothetical protein